MRLAAKRKNNATRLSDEIWAIGEALRRYLNASSVRSAIEIELLQAAERKSSDPEFMKILKEVRNQSQEQSED